MPCALIVDDDSLIRQFIRAQLEITGLWTCLEASDGKIALRMLSENHDVELVITDVVMPHMDGLQLIHILHRRAESPKLLAISAGGKFRTSLYLEDARKLGADAVIFKPFTGDELRRTVEALVPTSPLLKRAENRA